MKFIHNKEENGSDYTLDFEDGVRELIIDFRNQWTQWFGSFNWTDWTLIEVHFMDDKLFGAYELDLVLFGLGVHLRYNYRVTEALKKIKQEADEIRSGEAKTEPYHSLMEAIKK